tara:strand:+ start:2088 stop:2327 length:240 start_codon:yes stop_codon:yes gene_type:complete
MIKEIEQIKMNKYMKYLIESRGFNITSLGNALNVPPKMIRDWIEKDVTMQNSTFNKIYIGIQELKRQIKQAEDYEPNDN